jgi:hypothetical protein
MAVSDPLHAGIDIVPMPKFVRRTRGGRFPRRNISTFDGLDYNCACGRTHRFDVRRSAVVLELTGDRMVLQCPDAAAVTCVEIRRLSRRLIAVFGAWKRKSTTGRLPSAYPARTRK